MSPITADAEDDTDGFAAALAELDAAERGFLLGATMAAGGSSREPARRAPVLAGASGRRCARAIAALAAVPRTERVFWVGVLAREALAPVPAGIADVHPDWLQQILEAESSDTIRLVAADGPPSLRAAAAAAVAAHVSASGGSAAAVATPPELPFVTEASRGAPAASPPSATAASGRAASGAAGLPEVVAEIRRAVLAPIVSVPPLPPGTPPPARLGRLLAALPPTELIAEIGNAGAELLGESMRGAEDVTLGRVAVELGPPWADRFLRAAAAPPDVTAAEGVSSRRPRGDDGEGEPSGIQAALDAMVPVLAAVAPGTPVRETVFRLGARAVGARLAAEEEEGLAWAVAQRLPPAIGRELLGGFL